MSHARDYEDVLSGPEYFDCEAGKCRLRIAVCLGRQKANRFSGRSELPPYPLCVKCKQGEQNQAQRSPEANIKAKPRRGKGERNQGCLKYGECLDLAVEKGWKSWNCESCEGFQGEGGAMPDKPENTRICEDCKKRPTIRPKSPYCAACMAKRSNRGRKKRKIDSKAAKPKSAAQGKRRGEISPQRGDVSVTLDFSGREELFKRLKGASEEEYRSLEMQALYLIKKALVDPGQAERGAE